MTNLTDDDFNLGASQLRGNSDRQTRTIYMDPLAEDPEEAAKRRRLSELSELPQSDILANPGMGERAAAALTADRALSTTPRLRDWLNEPENAAVARDDIEHLSTFERLRLDVTTGNVYRRLGPLGDFAAATTAPVNPLGAATYIAQRHMEGGSDALGNEQHRQGQLDVEYAGLAYRAQQEARGYAPLTPEERARLDELATRDGQDNWGGFIIGPTRRLIPQLIGSFERGAQESGRRFSEFDRSIYGTPEEQRARAQRILNGDMDEAGRVAALVPVWLSGGATTAFGGAVGGYLSFGYEMETGMAFDQMVRAGIQPDIAAHRAEQYGAWATAIEFASDTLGIRISGTTRLATRVLLGERYLAQRPLVRATEAVVGMGLEQGFEESAQEYAQILHQDLAQQDQEGGESRVRWSEVLTPEHIKQILLSGYIGFQGGIGMGAVPSSANLALDVRAARQAEVGAQRFEEMTRAAQASRLNERGLASTMESAVGAMDDSSVYIDADRFVEHFQATGANAYAVADELGVGEQRLADALASHGQIEIPTSRFVARVLRIPQHASLAEHTRATPEAATPAEMQNAESVLKAQAERIVEETKTIESDNDLGRAIEARMRELFQAAEQEGGPRADVARRYAQLAAALPRAMVARARATDGAYADRLEQQFRHLFGVNFDIAGPGRDAGAGGAALDQRPVGVDAGPTRNERWDPPEGVRMSDKMREIVELAVNGASNDYIAEGMGVEANNVRVTLSQAKARLKRAGLSAPWEEGATGLPRGTNPRTGAGTYTTEELVALFDQLAAAGYTNSARPGGDNINTIIARRTGMNVKTVASRLSKHRAAVQEAERAAVREPEPKTAMEMRRQWVETQVVRHTVPGGEPGDFHYGFVLSSGKQMYVGIADDGNGAANIDWSFLERLKSVDEDNPTALYGDGDETLGIADGRELRIAIRAIFEADMAAHERPAYVYTPQRESNRRSNAKLREEMGDALGYDLLEDQGSVYLIRPGAGIANTGRIKPQPGWEPNFEEPQEYGSQEDADDAQNAFYARVEAVEVSADGPNLSEIARATRRERKEAEGRRAAAEQDAGGNARGDGSELEQNSARGSIRYENFRAGEFGQAMIRMGKSSDLSTFLHEFGHLGHLVLESMATDAAAPAEFKSMWTNTLQWWGLTQAEWDALTVEQKTPHFERWARTFEAYLMEGKAPSFSLRESFAAFKAWLTQIYRTVFRLNANLSPEIRDVFDRLLATDAEIAQARAAMGADFALAREAFKTEEEFQQYQQAIVEARDAADAELRARVMDAQVRKDKRWWRAERERVRATAEIEVDTAPARRAFEWLAYGEWRALPVEENEEGVVLPSNAAEQMPEDLPDMRLDWASLSEEERAGLPAEMRPLLDEGDVDAAVESAMALKRQGRQRQPQRLWVFIKAQGGIKDEGGEVTQALGSARSRPGLINNATGVSADELALRAWEAGYFGRVPGQTELGQERPDAEQLRAEGFDIEDPLYRGHEGDPSTGHWRASEGMNETVVFDPANVSRSVARRTLNAPDGGAAGAGNQSAWARVKDAVLGRAPDIEANIWIGPKSALWDAERAAQAEAMAQRGASPQEIWRETATFRGSDGSWRQETGLVPFSRAYPNARAHVRRELFDRGGGSYAPVGPFNLISGNEPRALTHELNHLASRIEGFAPGGNPIRAGIEAKLRGEQFRGAYERLPGEIDAERAAQRYHLNDEQRVERFPGTLTSADRMRQAAGLAPDAPNAGPAEGSFEMFQSGAPLIYHGSAKPLNGIRPILFATPDQPTAAFFARLDRKETRGMRRVTPLRPRFDNPVEVQANGSLINAMGTDRELWKLVEQAQANGNDAIIVHNVIDGPAMDMRSVYAEPIDVYIILDPKKVEKLPADYIDASPMVQGLLRMFGSFQLFQGDAAIDTVRARVENAPADVPRNDIPMDQVRVAYPKADAARMSARLADQDGELTTSWGATLQVRAGLDMIVGETQGEGRPVRKDIFDQTYQEVAPGEWAKRSDVPVGFVTLTAPQTINTLEGPVPAEAGDVVLIGAIGEMWPIRADKFAQRYDVAAVAPQFGSEAAGDVAAAADTQGRRPTPRELLDALIDDIKNVRQVYSSKDEAAVASYQNRTDAIRWFEARNIDLSGTKENIRAQIVAAMEEEQGRENAVDADTAASWFGFSSGAEMLDAIKGLKPRSVAIEENIDARLEGEYGDPLKDGTVAESARLAAHIEAQARRIEIELEAIQRATGGKKTPVGRAARAFAERQVQHMTVKQIREADQFLAAERRAARAAMEATQKKDFQTAGLMKQRQLISFHLYKLATDAAAEMERTQRYFQKFSRDTVRAKITPQHLDQIDQALEGIDLRSRPRINDRKRQSFQNWFDQMREAGLEHMVVADPDFLEQVRNKPFASLTLEEARAIRDAVRNLEHIGRRWREVLAARDQRLLDEAVGEMTASMAGVQPFEIANADNHSPGVVERLDRGRQALHGQLSRVEPVARAMDRNKDNGPVWNGLFRPLTEARDREEIRQEQAQKAIEALFSVYSAEERADMWVKRKFYPQVPNRTGSRMGRNFTKQEILALALNTGNEYNLGALLEGERKNSGMTEQQLRALLDVAMDQRDWEFVQSAWDYVNSFWPEIEALYVKTAGVAPAKVQPTPFTNRYGEWRGGYWHLEYDYGRDQRARDEADFVAVQEAFGGFRTRTQTPNGFSKARQGSGGRPVRLDLAILSEHVNEVIHDLEFRLPVLNVWRVIKHQGFRDAFVRAAGQEMYDTLKPWLQFTATERMPPERGFSGIIKTLRRNTPIALMGYAISTIAQQPAGLMGTFHRVGTARVMGKALQLMSQPWTWGEHARFINTRSHMMRNRSRISQRELREMIQEINSDAHVDAVRLLTAGTARQKVQALGYLNRVMQRYALFPLAFLDKWVSSAAWKAAYDRALAGHVDGVSPQNEADVIAYADQVIRTTFGSGRPEDMAPIMRSSEVGKLITPAFSYFNTQYNQLYNEQVPGMMRGHISPLEFVTFITFTLVMQALVSQWLAGRWDPDDGEDEDDRNARLAMEVAMTPVTGVPLVRDMTRAALRSAVTGERFSASTVPAFGAIGATASGVGGSLHDLSEDGEISRQSAKDLTMAASYWFGLPGRQMWVTGSYAADVAAGDEDLPWNSDEPIQTTSEALLRDTR